jgi:hypothetical protein
MDDADANGEAEATGGGGDAGAAMIPLYGFLHGDTIGLLILAKPDDTIAELADKLQRSAAVRVPRRGAVAVKFRERLLDPELTVAKAGLSALERFDVIPMGDA